MRVKCLVQEHNAVSPARAQTRTGRSVGERNNHEATVPQHYCALSLSLVRSHVYLGRPHSRLLSTSFPGIRDPGIEVGFPLGYPCGLVVTDTTTSTEQNNRSRQDAILDF